MIFGRTSAAMPSRFLKELPESEIVKKGATVSPKSLTADYSIGYGSWQNSSLQRQTHTEFSSTVSTGHKVTMLELSKGEMVQHTAFGRGMVLSVIKMGGDALLEIAFDKIGTKKLMAKTASAHMKKL